MDMFQRVLLVDSETGYYKIKRYGFDRYFGPVDLGMHMAEKYRSLNLGVGIFAGSVLPGLNRLLVTGFSPCWQGTSSVPWAAQGWCVVNISPNWYDIDNRTSVVSFYLLKAKPIEPVAPQSPSWTVGFFY